METTDPLVSVGLPVMNGEKFIGSTLDSLLSQTYFRLEIIICDNASTDGTQRICESYATNDKRIRYYRNESNLGAARNYNLTVEHATGTFFKWAAHDDLCKPTFIERCVRTLEQNTGVALAYPKTIIIDEVGGIVDDAFEDQFNFREAKPHHRYKQFTKTPLDCNAVFGVFRTDLLRQTGCIGPYESSDRVLLGEVALHGEIAEVPERLFLRRYHANVSTFACKTKVALAHWFDPASKGHFTRLRRFKEYIKSIRRSPISFFQQLYCVFFLLLFYVRMYMEPARWARVFGKVVQRISGLSFVTLPRVSELEKKEVF